MFLLRSDIEDLTSYLIKPVNVSSQKCKGGSFPLFHFLVKDHNESSDWFSVTAMSATYLMIFCTN